MSPRSPHPRRESNRTPAAETGPSPDGASTLTVRTFDTHEGDALDHIPLPVVTILLHPEGSRIGQRALVHELQASAPVALSRAAPAFAAAGPPGSARPLLDPHVSRTPLWIRGDGDALVFWAEHGGIKACVEGQAVAGELRLPRARLTEGGILLSLGGVVVLWLHCAAGAPPPPVWQGLIGVSPGMIGLRERITKLAGAPFPVMLRGESGSGKELVARALHQAGPRAQGPYVTLNMAAVPPTVAAAELFGYEKGAFTGAGHARKGRFEQADGGTLFLDEIGEAPAEVQSQLLRALDSGEIQPLGGQTRRVDVRVVSATDADLESRVAERRFSKALLYRMHSGVLEVPPLRERRVDIPVLLHHFLADGLKATGARDRLAAQPADQRPWLGARLVETLTEWPFPGNVRELKNFANEIVVHSAEHKTAELPPDLVARIARGPGREAGAGEEGEGAREPSSQEGPQREAALTAARVEDALRRNGWKLARAAADLGVARNTLVRFINESPELHRPSDLEEAAILEALVAARGSVEEAASALKVSTHGLRLRMNALGITEQGRG